MMPEIVFAVLKTLWKPHKSKGLIFYIKVIPAFFSTPKKYFARLEKCVFSRKNRENRKNMKNFKKIGNFSKKEKISDFFRIFVQKKNRIFLSENFPDYKGILPKSPNFFFAIFRVLKKIFFFGVEKKKLV